MIPLPLHFSSRIFTLLLGTGKFTHLRYLDFLTLYLEILIFIFRFPDLISRCFISNSILLLDVIILFYISDAKLPPQTLSSGYTI